MINTNKWNEILTEVNKTFSSFRVEAGEPFGGEVHLGKRSSGWKFLWNPNIYEIRNGHTEKEEIEPGHYKYHWIEDVSTVFKLYELTKTSIKEFIDSPDIEIYDEYGDKQDKEEFWNMAINWTTWINRKTGEEKEAWDGKSYELWEQTQNPNRYTFTYNSEYCGFLRGLGYNIEWPYTDFYSDGLRFSTSTEFS